MVGADPVERVDRPIVRDEDMPHLGMARAVDRAAVDDRAAAEARAYRDVDEAVEPAAGAPADLAERGRVNVGVEPDGYLQLLADWAHDVCIAPARLGRGGDVPVRRRTGLQVDRAERADANGRQRGLPVMRQQEVRHPG